MKKKVKIKKIKEKSIEDFEDKCPSVMIMLENEKKYIFKDVFNRKDLIEFQKKKIEIEEERKLIREKFQRNFDEFLEAESKKKKKEEN